MPRTPMRRRMRRRKLETEGSVRLTHPIQHQQQFSRGRTSGCGVAVRALWQWHSPIEVKQAIDRPLCAVLGEAWGRTAAFHAFRASELCSTQ